MAPWHRGGIFLLHTSDSLNYCLHSSRKRGGKWWKASYFRGTGCYQTASSRKAACQKVSISFMAEFVSSLKEKADWSTVYLACQDNQWLSGKCHRILLSSHADNVTMNFTHCVPLQTSKTLLSNIQSGKTGHEKKCSETVKLQFELIWLGNCRKWCLRCYTFESIRRLKWRRIQWKHLVQSGRVCSPWKGHWVEFDVNKWHKATERACTHDHNHYSFLLLELTHCCSVEDVESNWFILENTKTRLI